ncbi:hypothetical protein ACFVZD_37010 [Streptomyces sp. NPDC058287]|uniref:hypothetical protein n=1 Tax=Streptomyces sp. NPDC058287 TaxID=3346423 RepID=UPI0036E1AD99
MQAETIAALVASGAAVLGVPAALVVGLRQARAARQAAALAAESVRDQWRNSNRREAAVTFVVDTERALGETRKLSTSYEVVDLDESAQIRQAMWRAMAVVRIEGPKSLSDVAVAAYETVNDVFGHFLYVHRQSRPQFLLLAAAHEGNQTAKAVYARLLRPELRGDLMQQSVWANMVSSGLLPTKDLRRLERQLAWPALWPERDRPEPFHVTFDQARQQIDTFIEAVNAHLDGPPPE